MLTINDNWKRAARAGTIPPRLIVEISPTALYKERQQGGDWAGPVSNTGINVGHPTGELVLESEDVVHPEVQGISKQLGTTEVLDYNLFRGELETGWQTYEDIGQYIQTFRVDKAFRLKKPWVGVRNMHRDPETRLFDKFKSKLFIRLFSGLEEPSWKGIVYPIGAYPDHSAKDAVRGLYGDRVENIATKEVDYSDGSQRGAENTEDGENIFIELDFSDENVWIPGSGNVCAIDLSVSDQPGSENMLLFGEPTGNIYQRGQLWEHNHQTGDTYNRDADLGFKLWADGYKATGEIVYEFDLGEDPDSSLAGELELKYATPGDSGIIFQVSEKAEGGGWGSYQSAGDGSALSNKRYVRVKISMTASTDKLESPRVYGIRVAYRRKDCFVWGPAKIGGYPNLVSTAPTYSAEGDPLTGALQFGDISDVELLDPSAMISRRLFGGYNLKNDQITVRLGFEGLAASDFIPIKTLWIENWTPADGRVVINCYDKQRRIRKVEIPSINESKEKTEQIHFGQASPAAIKREVLARAGERPSRFDAASFSALDSGRPWALTHIVDEPTEAQKILKALNEHLLSFEYVDEYGKWVTPFVDFEASPAATIESTEIRPGSESYMPGWSGLANMIAVYFGGRPGGKRTEEKEYREICLLPDTESAEQFKEIVPDKLFSDFIPGDDDPGDTESGIAQEVANMRRLLQRDGLREVSFDTFIYRADIQIGDHVYLYSEKYGRPGASSPNPLLCFITRKHINTDLKSISWRALVLLDNEQTASAASAIPPAQNFNVTDNGNRTATWTWDKSSSDNGTNIIRYLLYRRKRGMYNWGAPVAEVAATGAADYEYTDSYRNPLAYDFGIRAVHKSRRVSVIVTKENVQISDSLPSPPTWELRPIEHGWAIFITADEPSAQRYIVYKHNGDTHRFEQVGVIAAPAVNPKAKVGETGHFSCYISASYGMEFGRFKVCSESSAGRGELSTELASFSLPSQGPLLASYLLPGLPSESGTWPKLTKVAVAGGDYKFYVELKITAPADYEDLIIRYEVQRREKIGETWGDWIDVPAYPITTSPGPHEIIWKNTDAVLVPGRYYEWRARAVGLSKKPSPWTASLQKQVEGPTTGPDKPTISVQQHPLGLLVSISPPAKGGQPIPSGEFDGFKIEGNKSSGWTTLVERHDTCFYLKNLANTAMSESWQFRVTAYDRFGNASPTSDASTAKSPEKLGQTCFQADCIETSFCDFVVVGTGNIVGTINASSEGLRIQATKIQVSGSCEFASGYDPTDKVDELGGHYNSAASGARVRIFPDAYTGLQIVDSGNNDVFRAYVGGAYIGDVVIGDTSSYYMMWDNSAGELIIGGTLKTKVGAGLNDDEEIKIGRVGASNHAEVQVLSGGNVCGILGGAGVINYSGTAKLWLLDEDTGGYKDREITVRGREIKMENDSSTMLHIQNNSNVSGTADFSAMTIDAGHGIDITGEWQGSPFNGYLRIAGTVVIDYNRNLTNIGSLTASSSVTCGGAVLCSSYGSFSTYVNTGDGYKIDNTTVLSGRGADLSSIVPTVTGAAEDGECRAFCAALYTQLRNMDLFP